MITSPTEVCARIYFCDSACHRSARCRQLPGAVTTMRLQLKQAGVTLNSRLERFARVQSTANGAVDHDILLSLRLSLSPSHFHNQGSRAPRELQLKLSICVHSSPATLTSRRRQSSKDAGLWLGPFSTLSPSRSRTRSRSRALPLAAFGAGSFLGVNAVSCRLVYCCKLLSELCAELLTANDHTHMLCVCVSYLKAWPEIWYNGFIRKNLSIFSTMSVSSFWIFWST